ncbi:MAG: phosphoribosylanthranilate isomerase [Candidatus Omnitrophica bacterium]|nr:phosphoribosylanthranilate isomerase [Candidatus Omnitrophota bacterium]
MVKVKICGITNLPDAQAAVGAGCDALGFVFYKKSPRYIEPRRAAEIIRGLPKQVVKIGVFVNASERFIRKTARLCRLDMLQFHGEESPAFCRRFRGFKVIKGFRVKDGIDIRGCLRYRVFAYLFDAFSSRAYGGTGRTLRWSFVARDLAGVKTTIFLSGGLDERNVARAIRCIRPAWVDASSCLEKAPGEKDHARIRGFVRKAKRRAR